ncbi:MAG: rhomboid family intramembrane serine protease [Cyanobacteria bacterium]|nr:rhomboid family intramembrane serine protease [Cyanobacteriota bacterium]MDW8201766.1 rhomboid family intramembrane serine protease [Cyanobacteriota bacterium SKYGB_h_bin112]
MHREKSTTIAQEIKTQIVILGSFVAVMWGVEILDAVVFGHRLNALGIRPRSINGLWGILFMPFLHGNFAHLIANTLPFVTLGWLIMLRETSDFFVVTILSMLVGGLGIWLIGSPFSVHIGASGVVFGYLGYLLLRGYFERSVTAIGFSIVVAILYGGTLFGLLPIHRGISWEGHLFGFLGGVLAAYLLAKRPTGT